MIAIYYPYWEQGSQWEELRYSLRSLEQHLKEDFKVYLVGDKPSWIQGVEHIGYKRVDIGIGSAIHNALRMQQLFLSKEICSDEFIRMNDDMYLLEDIVSKDLKVTRIIRTAEEVSGITSGGSIWRELLFKTINAAVRNASVKNISKKYKKGFMSAGHCPELFSIEKMQCLFSDYGMPEEKYLLGTLYMNVYPYRKVLIDKKVERALFYNEENEYSFLSENIADKVEGRKYLNHNDAGLNSELKQFIVSRYPNKSRFEK